MDGAPTAPSRQIFIFGGSNSAMKQGWTRSLREQIDSNSKVINLSCGAASSLMGLCRFLDNADRMHPGDVVIWEYALNDHTHFKSGQNATILVRYVKWMARLCYDRQLHFVPLVLHLRSWHKSPRAQKPRYYQLLYDFFKNARIEFVDDAPIVKGLVESGNNLDDLFRDFAHLSHTPGPMNQVVGAILKVIEKSTPLGSRTLEFSIPEPDANLSLAKNFGEANHISFNNSRMSLKGYPIDQGLKLQARGKILGLTMMTGTAKKALSIRVGKKILGPISTQASFRHVKKNWLFKQLAIEAAFPNDPLIVNGSFEIIESCPDTPPQIQHTFKWLDPPLDQPGRDARTSVFAALVEDIIPQMSRPPSLKASAKNFIHGVMARLRAALEHAGLLV